MNSIGGTILLFSSLVGIAPYADAAAVVTYHSSLGARAENIDSVQMLFDFSGGSSWRRAYDFVSRFSDNGRAEDPNNGPDVLPPVDSAPYGFLPGIFFNVALPAGAAWHVKVNSADVLSAPSATDAAPALAGSPNLSTDASTGGGGAPGGAAPGVVPPDSSSGNVPSVQAFDPMTPTSRLRSAAAIVPAAIGIPEPGTWLLMIIGSVGVLLGIWRRRRAS